KVGSYYGRPKDGLTIREGEAYQIKGHVLVSSPEELKKALQIALPELEALRNAGLIDYKIINPEDPGALVVGKGQGQKGINNYAKDPGKLKEALEIIDKKFAQHSGELPPIHPEGLDQVTGKSGHVAVVHDTFDGGINTNGDYVGARLEPQLEAKIKADQSLPH